MIKLDDRLTFRTTRKQVVDIMKEAGRNYKGDYSKAIRDLIDLGLYTKKTNAQ